VLELNKMIVSRGDPFSFGFKKGSWDFMLKLAWDHCTNEVGFFNKKVYFIW
jgi:hypothetical protein